MKKPSRHLAALPLLLAVTILAPACQGRDVPYVPTPDPVVSKMLEMGRAGPGDIVYDLGSGDGRIVIAAARDFNAARAVGIDIDSELIFASRKSAEAAGVGDRAIFIQQNIFETDFSEATVLTMYLLTRINLALRPRILSQLKPGTRVVSHQFSMGDWQPDETASIGLRRVFLWIVPAKAAGLWRGTLDGRDVRLRLVQTYQKVGGRISMDGAGEPAPLDGATLVGDRLRFSARLPQGGRPVAVQLDGRVEGDRLAGTLTVDGRASTLVARRVD